MDKQLCNLSDEELKILSLETNKNKSYTKRALMAQSILWKRAGEPFQSSAHYKRDLKIVNKF